MTVQEVIPKTSEREEGISMCRFSDKKKRVGRHIGRDGLGDVCHEVFVSVPSRPKEGRKGG